MSTFEVGEEAIRFTLGEITAAPRYQNRDNPVGDAISTVAGAFDPRNQLKVAEWIYDTDKEQLERDPVVSTGMDVLSDFGNVEYDHGFVVGVWEGGQQAVQELTDALKAAGEMLTTALQSPAALIAKYLPKAMSAAKAFSAFLGDPGAALRTLGKDLAARWNNPSDYSRGQFRGLVVGYLVVQEAAAVITDGILTDLEIAAKVSGFFQKFLELFEESGALTEEGLSVARSAAGTIDTVGTATTAGASGAGGVGDAAGAIGSVADTAATDAAATASDPAAAGTTTVEPAAESNASSTEVIATGETESSGAENSTSPTATTSSVPDSKTLLENASRPFKGGTLTNAGRAITKHPEVIGFTKATLRTALATDAEINAAAEQALREMLASSPTELTLPRYGAVLQFTGPTGFGVRFYAPTGDFIGFINP